MAAFLSKVFPRKKDKDATNKRNSSSSLLEGKFEAVSPTVSPSAAQFSESAQQLKERGREKEKEKESGFSLFRPKSRPLSPTSDTRKSVSDAPHLTLNLPVPKEERSRALGVVFEADPNDTSTLPENVIGERRLNPLEALLLVKACSTAIIDHGGLETLGVMHPFWYSASPEVQRKLISLSILSLASKSPITTLSPSPTSAITDFNTELEFTRSPHDIAAVLRWALRHLRLEGDSFGRTTEQWKWYQTFVEAERASSYPPTAFTDTLVPQLPPSHHQLLVATLEIVSSLASHSEHNGISGSKLSKFFGLWLLTTKRGEDGEDWSTFYSRWERAGRVLEHLFLAHIRDEMVRKKMPLRLAELVKGYPYHNRSPSADTAATADDELLPRPRFSTRQYSALFVRVETELPDAKAAKPKPHPLRLISEALKSDLELTDAQYQAIWEAIRKAALTSDEPEPILMSVDGFPSLSRIFADETTRLLSFVPAETGASVASSVPTIRLPRPPRRRTSSLNSPTQTQPQTNGNGKASTNGTTTRTVTSPTSPTSPSSPKDWMDFSSSGFGESTLGKDFAKTLLDKDVEVTTPPVERKTSRRRKPSPRRSSVDNPDPESATRAAELPGPKPVKSKSTIVSLIKLDEAFIDFWSDALTDPIVTSDWPNFVVAQLKAIPGVEIDGKPVGWLVLEQRFLPPPPPPPTSEESVVSPTTTRRPSSPKPSIRSELSQRRVSTTLSAMKKRFTFASSSQTIAGVAAKTETKTASRKPAKGLKIGEMGEILPEVEEKPEEKKEQPKETEKQVAPVPAPKPVEESKAVEDSKPAATQPIEAQKAPAPQPVQEITVPSAAAPSAELPSPTDAMSPLTPTADDFPAVPVVGGLLAAATPAATPDAVEPIKTEDAVLEDTPVVDVPEQPAAVPVDTATAAPEEKSLPPAPEHVVLTGETPGPQVALSTSEPAALAELSTKVDEIVREASPDPDAQDVAPAPVVAAPEPEPEVAPAESEAAAPVPVEEAPAPVEEEAPVSVEEAPAVEEPAAPEPIEPAAPVEPEPAAIAAAESSVTESEAAAEEAAPVAEAVSEPAPAVEAGPVVEAATPATETAVEESPAPEPEPEPVVEAAAPEPEPAPVVEEKSAPTPEPVVEAAAPEPEPVVEAAPAPESEPVVEEAPAAEPEPVVEEAVAAAEPEPAPAPVVEEAPAPEPQPEVAPVAEAAAEPEAPVTEEVPAVEETAAEPEAASAPAPEPEAPTEEAPAPAEPTPEEPAAPVEEVKEEVAEPESTAAPAVEETAAETPAPGETAAPVVEEPVAEEFAAAEHAAPAESAPAADESAHEETAAAAPESVALAPEVSGEPAHEEPQVESVAPAEVASEEPAAPAAAPEKHTEVPAVEEKYENGAADAEEKPTTAEESQ